MFINELIRSDLGIEDRFNLNMDEQQKEKVKFLREARLKQWPAKMQLHSK